MRIHNQTGLSLTELLISTVIIGTIMLGIMTFSTSVRQMQSASSRTRYTDMKLAAAMKALKRDALQAIGDRLSPGIVVNSGTFETICFRHDLALTPLDYTDDTWACWMSSTSDVLRRCFDPSTMPPTSVAECTASTDDRQYFQLTNTNFFTINTGGGGRFDSVTLTLSAHDINAPVDPLTNPEMTLTMDVSPPAHSR